ncbi:MAG TPA: hypothetical protein VN608_08195 [Clostridia bacterium]|nr:hypothetical protein [Clostridia bacterium]
MADFQPMTASEHAIVADIVERTVTKQKEHVTDVFCLAYAFEGT